MKPDCPFCNESTLITYETVDRWSMKYNWKLERIIGSVCACEGLHNLSRVYMKLSPDGVAEAIYFYDGESSPDEIEAALACTGHVQYSLNLDVC